MTRQRQKKTKWGGVAITHRVRFIPFIISTFGGLGPAAAEFLKWIAGRAYEQGIITGGASAEHMIGQYKWLLTQRLGVAMAHANSCMVQESRARATQPKCKTKAIYDAVQKRGHKRSRGEAAPRVYVYAAKERANWPKGKRRLGEPPLERAEPRSAQGGDEEEREQHASGSGVEEGSASV